MNESERHHDVLTLVCDILQTYFLPVIGLVDAEKLTPGDLVVGLIFISDFLDKSHTNMNHSSLLCNFHI